MLGSDAPSRSPNDVHLPVVRRQTAGPAETVMLHGKATALAATDWSWSLEQRTTWTPLALAVVASLPK